MTAPLAAGYDLVILDLDGVVYLGSEAVPGAPETIEAVAPQTPVAYVTNNASRSTDEVAALLGSLGIKADASDVLTSAGAAAMLLAAELPSAAPVLVVGSDALRTEIRSVGLTPVRRAEPQPRAVVQGYGPGVGWADLAEACVAIQRGARWVATNTDATLPSPRGPLPGNGSLVAALSTALGGRAPDTVVGKPEPPLFAVAARRHGARRVLVVGDRVDTDIRGARRAGMDSLLVLTGVSTAADLFRAAGAERPTHVGASLRALVRPDGCSRVPQWVKSHGAAQAGRWRVTYDGARLVLADVAQADVAQAKVAQANVAQANVAQANAGRADDSDGIDAVRALAAAAWAHPGWSAVTSIGPAAARTLEEVGLVNSRAGTGSPDAVPWRAPAASTGSVDPIGM